MEKKKRCVLLFRGLEEVVFFTFLYAISLHRSRDQSVLCKQEMISIFSLLEKKGFLFIEKNYRGWEVICQLTSLEGRLSHIFLDA